MPSRVSLTRALSRAVACALVGGSGCGGEEDHVELPVDAEFGPLECLPAEQSSFEHMQLSQRVDFIAIRGTFYNLSSLQPERQGQGPSLGAPCAGARNVSRCEQKLAESWPSFESPWKHCTPSGCDHRAVVLTKGDDVEMLDSAHELRRLLGEVDTADEAVLLAAASGFGVQCGLASIATVPGGYALRFEETIEWCPVRDDQLTVVVSRGGSVRIAERLPLEPDPSGVCVGRRPEGLLACAVEHARGGSAEVGRVFAQVARLERSAVTAFEVMAAELAALRAPRSLQRAARRAARDEVRHARVTAELARRHGVEPLPVALEARPLRPLMALALDNVREGCVRETYGAACGRYQARRARSPEVRAKLTGVARDEQRHAQLSWRIHRWASSLMSAGERSELARAAQDALALLRRELAHDWGQAVCDQAGMPSPQAALALFTSLEAELWRPAGFAAANG